MGENAAQDGLGLVGEFTGLAYNALGGGPARLSAGGNGLGGSVFNGPRPKWVLWQNRNSGK
jgi:hypothetical protein